MLASRSGIRRPNPVIRILVIGGYGGFGGRLSRRLVAAGHHVIVGGRDGEKAARFCAGLTTAEPAEVDRTANLGPLLADLRPDLVIDAAGPFQNSGYAAPEACIAAGVHYLDLADGRDFVTGIEGLDEAARTAGVVVISGASTLPALSGALARHLSADLDSVAKVEMALSASARSTANSSIVRGILSYVGHPLPLWLGRRVQKGYGWQRLRRHTYTVAGVRPLRCWVALADVPDLELLPSMLSGRPSVEFRAGTDNNLHMLFLWLASWPVRWGWLRSLRPATSWLLALQRLTSFARGERSAMQMTVNGRAAGRPRKLQWTLIADHFHGPEIPTIAAVLLADDIAAGRLQPSASHAGSLLSVDRFAEPFARLSICQQVIEQDLSPLYQRLMGERFGALPRAVREMHQVHGDAGAAGEGTVGTGEHAFARLLCRLMRFPPAGTHPLHVAFMERDGVETWTRDFGGHCFQSRVEQSGAHVTERFGPIRFAFDLPSDDHGLRMVLRRWSIFAIPLPLLLAPRIEAREWEQDGRFRFSVDVAMPAIGPVIRYAGWLEPV